MHLQQSGLGHWRFTLIFFDFTSFYSTFPLVISWYQGKFVASWSLKVMGRIVWSKIISIRRTVLANVLIQNFLQFRNVQVWELPSCSFRMYSIISSPHSFLSQLLHLFPPVYRFSATRTFTQRYYCYAILWIQWITQKNDFHKTYMVLKLRFSVFFFLEFYHTSLRITQITTSLIILITSLYWRWVIFPKISHSWEHFKMVLFSSLVLN